MGRQIFPFNIAVIQFSFQMSPSREQVFELLEVIVEKQEENEMPEIFNHQATLDKNQLEKLKLT